MMDETHANSFEAIMSDVDFGPLQELIGVWKGDNGTDMAPE